LLIAYCLLSAGIFAQKQKIAVFAPLFLDSAFDATGQYRFGKTFPKFINPGLEFYEGVQLALDSLQKEGAPLEVFIYDTKATSTSLQQQLSNSELDSVGLIIAHATMQENKLFADAAKAKKIPYINPNLPNDGGIMNNPYFVLLNSTLKTHVEGAYRFLQRQYSLNPIIVFRKKGVMEDMIKTYFDDFGKSTMAVPLKLKYVDLTDSFTVAQIKTHLDSNAHVVCLAATLDENFSRRLALQLASISKSYKSTMIGMPTFENASKDFNKPEFKGPEIIYSTPLYNPRTDKVSRSITNYFSIKMYARPSDMVMRGYEATWRFSKLLIQYQKDIAANLTRKEFNVFREFDIQPIINKQTATLDYFENKKLYFIVWQDGVIKTVY
jgi:ABC-type branched-subunit amino acid transport system substrate-binding protein